MNPVSSFRSALALLALASLLPAQGVRPPDLPPGSEHLQAPAGNIVSFHVYAVGVQVHRWDAATGTWRFAGPLALLFVDAAYRQPVGLHFAGPTWTSPNGSSVVGSFRAGSVVDADAIPWLLLDAASSKGPGIFAGTTFIQRVNTTGGLAPDRPGTAGEVVEVPYTAEYYFYRAP